MHVPHYATATLPMRSRTVAALNGPRECDCTACTGHDGPVTHPDLWTTPRGIILTAHNEYAAA